MLPYIIEKNINNIPIYIYKSTKFKTVNVKLVFINHFNEDNATKYSLLTSVLSNTSKKYNTKMKVSNALKNLYGANIYLNSNSCYKTRITTITLSMINEKYINEKINKKAVHLLYEFLFNPNIIDNKFNDKVFNEEKNNLSSEIKKIIDRKSRYALRQMIKSMCHGEIASVSNLGTLEQLEKITQEDIYETYLDLINNSEKSIYIIGDLDESCIKSMDLSIIINRLTQQKLELETVLKDNKIPLRVNKVFEKNDICQAHLVLGYRSSVGQLSSRFEAMQLFNLMLGGLYTSNLFQVIREERGLCYDIFSSYASDSKVMIIEAGIDKVNYYITCELIQNEIKKYQEGIVSNELLEMAKISYIEELIEMEDRPNLLLSNAIENRLLNIVDDVDLLIERINSVTVNDIVEVSKTLILDTIYILSDGDKDEFECNK